MEDFLASQRPPVLMQWPTWQTFSQNKKSGRKNLLNPAFTSAALLIIRTLFFLCLSKSHSSFSFPAQTQMAFVLNSGHLNSGIITHLKSFLSHFNWMPVKALLNSSYQRNLYSFNCNWHLCSMYTSLFTKFLV